MHLIAPSGFHSLRCKRDLDALNALWEQSKTPTKSVAAFTAHIRSLFGNTHDAGEPK